MQNHQNENHIASPFELAAQKHGFYQSLLYTQAKFKSTLGLCV